MKYIDKKKKKEGMRTVEKQEITLNINYSTPYQPLVQFKGKYDK